MPVFVGLAGAFLWIYCILDVILAEETLIRNLPKRLWLFLVLFFPVVGSIVWLVAGRPADASFRPGDTTPRATPQQRPSHPSQRSLPPPPRSGPAVGPEDSPEFMRRMEEQRLRAWADELRKREEDLRKREQGED